MKRLILMCVLLCSALAYGQETDSIHVVVDEPPRFPGGQAALTNWLAENVSVPDSLRNDEHVSHMVISFVVEKDGTLTHIRTNISHHPDLSRHIAGTIKSMPKWTPGRHQGVIVRAKYHLPIMVCAKPS